MFPRLAAVALATLILTSAARASELLRNEVRTAIAVPIQKLLEEENQQAIAVGEFTGPAQLDTNAGPGLQQLLADELRTLKVNVQKTANLSVKGRYARVDNQAEPGQLVVKLTAEVFDRNDDRKAEFHALLRGTGDIARVLAVTATLPPPDEPGAARQRKEEISKRLADPQVFVNGSLVKPTADSPFAVELLVKPSVAAQAAPRAAEVKAGQAFVGIRRDEIYEVRAYNRTSGEVAITLTIDGLDVFTFSEVRDPTSHRPKYRHYIVPPAKDGRPGVATVPGWHLRDAPPNNYTSFLVTEYGKGASSRVVTTPKAGKPGVITVTFAPAFVGNEPRSPGSETGFGPPVSVKVEPVKRSIGPEAAVVSIRYSAVE